MRGNKTKLCSALPVEVDEADMMKWLNPEGCDFRNFPVHPSEESDYAWNKYKTIYKTTSYNLKNYPQLLILGLFECPLYLPQ